MTLVEAITLITSLVSLGVAWRAYLLSRQAYRLQDDAHRLQSADVGAKQEPRLQVSGETFLSTWQRNPEKPKCDVAELELVYSSILQNKGGTVARLHHLVVELGISAELLGEPITGFGVAVAGPLYLAAGEAIALTATVTPEHLKFLRLFFSRPAGGVVTFTLAFGYSGYADEKKVYRREIYRMNDAGEIVSMVGYDAVSPTPRTYPLLATSTAKIGDA